MKKFLFSVFCFVFLLSTAAIAADTEKTKKWVKAEPVLVHEATDSAQVAIPPTIPPTMWFSWGPAGTESYYVSFYGANMEPVYRAFAFMDGARKGRVAPQATFINPNNPDPSSELVDLKQLIGQFIIHEPGLHHAQIRVYVDNQTYYSFTQNNIEVPYFDAGVYGISTADNIVYIKYYIDPLFISVTPGETVNININNGAYQFTTSIQLGQYAYFVEVSMDLSEYQSKLQGQQLPTTVEIQGHNKTFDAYYWNLY